MRDYLNEYYSGANEDARLLSRHGSVEYLTTMRYIHKYLNPGARVLEVGAGTGRYTLALAREGYRMSAVELLEHNLGILRGKLGEGDDVELRQGNALDLSAYPDAAFDGVLLLGPMYHLYRREDKLRALSEAKRVTRPGGVVMAAYCMNEATIISWGFAGDGEHLQDAIRKGMLTEDFHCISKPEDIFEMTRLEDIDGYDRDCALRRLEIVATDLFTNYMKQQVDAWSDAVFETYLRYHFTVCARPDLIGLTHHALDILRR